MSSDQSATGFPGSKCLIICDFLKTPQGITVAERESSTVNSANTVENSQYLHIPIAARLFIIATGLAGMAGMFFTFRGWALQPSAPFVVYVLLALAGSTMNVSFPGMHGNFSVNVVI